MTPGNDNELDLRRLVGVLWHRAWLIALVVAVAFVAAYGYTARQADRYAATAQVQISDPNQSSLKAVSLTKAEVDRDVATQIQRMKSNEVRVGVEEALGPDTPSADSVTISPVTDTNLVKVRVTDESPQVAAAAANAYAEVYVRVRQAEISKGLTDRGAELRTKANELSNQMGDIDVQLMGDLSTSAKDALTQQRAVLQVQQGQFFSEASDYDLEAGARASTVTIAEPAQVPTSPYAPTPLRDAVPVAMVALFLAVGAVLVAERFDDKVTDPDQIEELAPGVAVLGLIPAYSSRRRGERKLPHGDRTIVPLESPAAEAYRTLRTSLRFSSIGAAKQTIALTSPSGGEGKSTISANLAVTLAESGLGVVLVSADLRRPCISSMFGVSDTELGLTSILLGDAPLSECLVNVELASGKNLYLLPAGPLPHNPAELLGSPAFGALLRQIESAGADFVLIDCPPVLPVSDPLAIAQHVDGVLVVAVVGRTRRTDLAQTIERLQQVKANIVGVTLNGVPTRGNRYGYFNRYGYGAANTYASTPPRPGRGGAASEPVTIVRPTRPSVDDRVTSPPSPVRVSTEPDGRADSR